MLKKLSLIAFLAAWLSFGFSKPVYASHLAGAELTYTCVAPAMYQVQLKLFRDCMGINATNSYPLNIKSVGCNSGRSITLNKGVTTSIANPFCSTLTSACSNTGLANYEIVTYTGMITFTIAESACSDWTLGVGLNDGNRNNAANINGAPAMYVEAFLKLGSNINNNSAEFNLPTPQMPFVNHDVPFLHSWSGYDDDGDSLVYSLVPALEDANTPVNYVSGFNAQNPFASATPVSFNTTNGLLSFKPNAFNPNGTTMNGLNKYTAVIKIEEWRKLNGVFTKVGAIMRDMSFNYIEGNANINPKFTTFSVNNNPILASDLIRIKPGLTMNLQINMIDQNAADILQLTSDVSSRMPGATLTVSGGATPTGTITWTPTAAQVRNTPYFFTLKVTDDACPYRGYETRTLAVKVSNTGNVTGTKSETTNQLTFIAYPNPFTEKVSFKVNLTYSVNQEIQIYNALGKLVDKISLKGLKAGEQEVSWEKGAKLAKGNYIAKLVKENQIAQTIQFSKMQ